MSKYIEKTGIKKSRDDFPGKINKFRGWYQVVLREMWFDGFVFKIWTLLPFFNWRSFGNIIIIITFCTLRKAVFLMNFKSYFGYESCKTIARQKLLELGYEILFPKYLSKSSKIFTFSEIFLGNVQGQSLSDVVASKKTKASSRKLSFVSISGKVQLFRNAKIWVYISTYATVHV